LSSINSSTFSAVFWWRPACWLRVSGDDAETFLQGQFTNDLRSAGGGDAVYGLWLNVKGKVLADSFVIRSATPGEFWIASYYSPTAVVRERLESFIIADDVTIEDATAGWAAVAVLGPKAMATGAVIAGEPPRGFAFRGRRTREENTEWIFPVSEIEAVRARIAEQFPGAEIGPDEIARLRIAAAVPAVPADVGPTDLPNEAGLEADAISYTKGCYLGQEVMARLKSMGQVRRRLLRVAGTGSADLIPPLPAALFAGERRVGELRSVAPDGANGVIGLAMLSLLHVTADAALAFAAGAAPALRVLDRP
jgi:tRNA-modifying protein YgfZ